MVEFSSTDQLIDIAIVGAGIGGTAAAIALRRAGFEVDVFEQTARLREVGGGIVIRQPSMALLGRWGVLDQVRPKMVAVNAVEVRDRKGKVLATTPTAVEAEESEFAYCVHRADIHDALIAQLRHERLHLGHRLASVQILPEHAEAAFDNGASVRSFARFSMPRRCPSSTGWFIARSHLRPCCPPTCPTIAFEYGIREIL
jgi:salicylate hydroxylase